jgi:hypothetical protein
VNRVAEHLSHCDAGCGELIEPGDQYVSIRAGDGWHAIHPGCLPEYKQRTRTGQRPARNAPRRAEPEQVERQCSQCGEWYAGPPSEVAATCRKPGWQLSPPVDGRCGGRLVPPGEAPAATTFPDGARQQRLEGTAGGGTTGVGRLRKTDWRAALDGESHRQTTAARRGGGA